MNVRLALSRLESADARASAARALAVICAIGYILSLTVMFALGYGLERWLFVLLVWTLLVYLPLRILLEAFQTIGPAIRRTLVSRAAADPARYRSNRSIELVVDGLFERDVLMPRIAKPQDGQKARDASAAVLRTARGSGLPDLEGVAVRCLGTVEQWITDLAGWAQTAAQSNIQARWDGLRALAAFAAFTKILISAAADQSGRALSLSDPASPDPAAYLDACLDYCDQLALEIDVATWTEPSLRISVSPDASTAIRIAWTGYVQTPPPAIDARNSFVKTLLQNDV